MRGVICGDIAERNRAGLRPHERRRQGRGKAARVNRNQVAGSERFGLQLILNEKPQDGDLADDVQEFQPRHPPWLQLTGRLDGGDGKHDRIGRLFAEPHIHDLAACLGFDVPTGQQRRVDFRDLEPLGNDETEAIDRAVKNPKGHGRVEFFIGLGHFVKQHAAGGHGLLAALQVAVQRHEDGRIAGVRQQLETGEFGPFAGFGGNSVHFAGNHIRPTFDLDVARHGEPPAADRGVGQAETQILLGGVHFQRGDQLQHQLVTALPGDEQVQPPVGRVAHGSGPVVEFGRQKAHAAEIQRNRLQTLFQHVDRDRAMKLCTALVDRDIVVGRDGHGSPGERASPASSWPS